MFTRTDGSPPDCSVWRDMSIPSDDTPVERLRNIGSTSVQMLASMDVHTAGNVRHLGIPLIMKILKDRGLHPSMNLAYALYAGLNDQHWLDLDPETKRNLKETCQDDS